MPRLASFPFLVTLIMMVSLPWKVLAQDEQYKILCVGFYNLENLFDTIIDPDTTLSLRDEFTPKGSMGWNTTKYTNKLNNMSRVISEIGTDQTPDGVVVLGVSEIENREVLEDLVEMPSLKKRNYGIIHFSSPDRRGIDVGLLYQKKYFIPESQTSYTLILPEDSSFKTRDQLLVVGKLDGERMAFIVGHWPSRRGGQQASAHLRNACGDLCRHIVDSLLSIDPNFKIVLMGDLNDDPVDESLTTHLKAGGVLKKLQTGFLFNTMWSHYKSGNGTLAWNDAWNLFDQIVISQGLTSTDPSTYIFHNAYVFKKDYILESEGRFAGYPLRTHAGGVYLNGFSDHLPTYILLKKRT